MADRTITILLEAEAKGVQQAKGALTSIAQVEKAHARAIRDTGRERVQTEKAHAQAIRLLEQEQAAVDANRRKYGEYATKAGAALTAVGAAIVNEWDQARKTIVEGTGATGEALDALMGDFESLSGSIAGVSNEQTSAAIADLNTHLGLTGPALQTVAEAALKAGVDTNQFGSVAKQLGLDAQGSTTLLDQLTVAAQNTGVDVDTMTRTIGRSSARWLAAGGTMEGLTATVVSAADEFGPAGLRGAMSELLTEVDKGVIPATKSLEDQLGNTAGAVDRTHEASVTWFDRLEQLKSSLLTAVNPEIATFATGVGGATTAIGGMIQAMPGIVGGMSNLGGGIAKVTGLQKLFNLAMAANPIGLVITAVGLAAAAYITWKDEINAFLVGAWDKMVGAFESGWNWISKFVPFMDELPGKMEPATKATANLSDELAGHSLTTAFEEAKKKGEEFLDTVGTRFAVDMKASINALKSVQIQMALQSSGHEGGVAFASAFNAGYMQGPGGMMNVIPQNMMQLADDGSWTLAGGKGAENFATGGGGGGLLGGLGKWLGGGGDAGGIAGFFQNTMGGVSGVMSSFVNGDWKTSLGNMVSMGLNTLVPGLGTVANLAFGAFKGVFDFFKKPSESELATRETFHSIAEVSRTTLGNDALVNAEYQSAIRQGWSETEARTVAAFLGIGKQAGLTHDEAFNYYAQYEQAVRDGNEKLVNSITADFHTWMETAQSSMETSTDAIVSGADRAAAGVNNAMSTIQTDYTVRVHYDDPGPPSFSGEGPEGRQFGGPVQAGRPYVVGERRPELFVPQSSGHILPSVPQASGPRTIIVQLPDGNELARAVFTDGPDVGDWINAGR